MRKKHVVFNIQQQRKNELETFSARVFEFVLHLISLAITRFAWSKLLLLHPFRRRRNHSLSRVTHDVVTKNAEVWEFWRSTKQRSLFLRLILCCDFKSRDFLWFPSAVRHLKPPSSRVTCVRDSLSCRPLEKNRVRYLVPPRFASRSPDAAALFDSKSYSNLKVNALVDHINFFLSHYCLPNQTWFLSTYLTKVVLPSPKGLRLEKGLVIVIVLWRQCMWLYHYMYALAYMYVERFSRSTI